jgi:hypothetical protein
MALRDAHRYFDKRTVARHVKSGRLTQAEVDQFLAGLPDVSDKVMDRDEGGDDDGYEDDEDDEDDEDEDDED